MSSTCKLLWSICIVLLTIREIACNGQQAESVAAEPLTRRSASSDATLRVTSILVNPFLSRRSDSNGEDFVGFIPDLLDRVAQRVHFDYEIRLVSDGKFGSKMRDGQWNGMIGEVTRAEADLAAAPLVVTSARERVVDFSKPFMGDRIAAIIKKSFSRRFDIHSISDLGRHSTVKYAVLADGATEEFLRSSKIAEYERIWEQIANNHNSSLVHTIEEGLQRVLASSDQHPWAFVSLAIALAAADAHGICELVAVSSGHVRPLSLAMPIGSTYRDRITLAILELLENGEVNKLRAKWFPPVNCDAFSLHFAVHHASLLFTLTIVVGVLALE